MIILKNLSKKYGNNKVLKNINLILENKKMYVIKGVSGCGKSTLLGIIAGLITDYTGDYYYNNVLVNAKNIKNIRQKFGYINQKSMLISNITILDNLLFIKDDRPRIERLAKEFDVSHTLNKTPGKMSGGERQRISIIRALLEDPEIIIADEPTSSLDQKNSIKFVKYLEKIKDKTVIIATHKDIFDEYADFIINLDYGVINTNEKITAPKNITTEIPSKKQSLNIRSTINYVKKRQSSKSWTKNIFLILAILVILATVSVKMNFYDEYIKINMKNYPYYVINLDEYIYNELKEKDKFILYENYTYKDELFTAYALLPYEDSNFKIPHTIEYGTFPKNKNEIIVNKSYVTTVLNTFDFKSTLGATVKIKDKEFKISAITTDDPEFEYYTKHANTYYSEAEGALIFIDYDTMKEIGKITRPKFGRKMYKYIGDNNIYNKKYFDKDKLMISDIYSTYENKVGNIVCVPNMYADTAVIALTILSLIGFLFIYNKLSLNLFYRQKEFGYFMAFGLPKNRIQFIVLYEYMSSVIKSLLISIIIYFIIGLIINIEFDMNLLISPVIIIFISIIILLYTLSVIILPLKKYLKKDIYKLMYN